MIKHKLSCGSRLLKYYKRPFSSRTSGEEASKEFEKRVNNVNKSENEDYSSVEQYMKVFNEKVYKQNLDLSHKINEIFKDDSTPSGSKIFTAVNEINKINLNNSSTLLQVFLNQILKYNDSVRLFIQQTEKKSSRYGSLVPISALLIWVCGGIFLYSYYKKKNFNYEKTFDNLIKSYNDNAVKSLKLDVHFPVFDDHKNVTNLVGINFEDNSHIVLIGPKSIGKSESVKHFALTQGLKDHLCIYIDLNNSQAITDLVEFNKLIRSKLLERFSGKDKNIHTSEIINSDEFATRLYEYLKSKKVSFVFDNYSNERDAKVFDFAIPSISDKKDWTSLIISNTNEINQLALQYNYLIKYVNFIQSRSFKNYLVEKLNTYCKKRVDYSSVELFNEENMGLLYKSLYFFSFKDLSEYLQGNSSIESFLKRKDDALSRKLKMLRLKDIQTYETLKTLIKSVKDDQPFQWIKLPLNTRYDSLINLEKMEFIFSKDHSEYAILNNRIKKLIDDLEKK